MDVAGRSRGTSNPRNLHPQISMYVSATVCESSLFFSFLFFSFVFPFPVLSCDGEERAREIMDSPFSGPLAPVQRGSLPPRASPSSSSWPRGGGLLVLVLVVGARKEGRKEGRKRRTFSINSIRPLGTLVKKKKKKKKKKSGCFLTFSA